MKSLLGLLLLISCTRCVEEHASLQTQLTKGKTYYWIGNSEKEFHALDFDSATCNLFSFGEGQVNSRQKFNVRTKNKVHTLVSPHTEKKMGVQIFGDSMILLHQGRDTFEMVVNPEFDKLFSRIKAKYSFECVQSNQISYNGIVPEFTRAEPFLKNTNYKQKTEVLEDEIYGTEVLTFLEYAGNRFYYTKINGQQLFDKIEIVSKELESAFLDIRIGDTFDQVIDKLNNEFSYYRVGETQIKVRICNSKYVGSFGTLIFRFHTNADKSRLLEMIICQPFDES